MSNKFFNTDTVIDASEQYFTTACSYLPESVAEHAQNFVRASHSFTRSAAATTERMFAIAKTSVEDAFNKCK